MRLIYISFNIREIASFPIDLFTKCLKCLIRPFAYSLLSAPHLSLSTSSSSCMKKPHYWSNWPASVHYSLWSHCFISLIALISMWNYLGHLTNSFYYLCLPLPTTILPPWEDLICSIFQTEDNTWHVINTQKLLSYSMKKNLQPIQLFWNKFTLNCNCQNYFNDVSSFMPHASLQKNIPKFLSCFSEFFLMITTGIHQFLGTS